MKKYVLVVLAILSTIQVFSQNPIIRDQFTADPTARVFEGKVFLFPSHDIISPIEPERKWFSMEDYHVFSSENLVDWKDHGVIVTQNKVPWVREDSYAMWAPDAIEKNGKYYFYFPAMAKPEFGRGSMIGVAIADHPEGPYTPLDKPIAGTNGIDPGLFIDKDGQAYLYWCGGGMWVAKLKPNMIELDGERHQVQGLPTGGGLKEGPFLFERNGIYYYTYPWVKNNTTEVLYYCMGDNPMGPFKDGGVIMDESPVGCWTNHHSIVEYKNQWYLFYHHNDYSPDFDKNRSARIDSVHFNSDGTIQKVITTLRGVGITNAEKEINLDRYSGIQSDTTVLVTFINPVNKFEGWKTIFNKEGAWIRYNNVDFGAGALKKVMARVYSARGGTLTVSAGKNGDVPSPIARIEVPPSGKWSVLDFNLSRTVRGVQDIFVSLNGNNRVQIDWISFE
ncbi:MAG: family 43 glycosylhydrolase [Petrimonas sp.]|nr:family 43 glycosylhydrolase [Petrimonas sp.]